MRFAWERENRPDYVPIEQSFSSRLIYIVYNVVWWLPLVLALIGTIDYREAFVPFFVIIIIRAVANLYRNNVLSLEQAESFPLRAP